MCDDTLKKKEFHLKTLKPAKYKQLDFFVADTFSPSSIRDDILSMEHPFFALKAGDKRIRKYTYSNSTTTISPHASHGVATIFDKDIWLYAISKLQQAMYENQPISRTIRFTAYDYFRMSNREDGGKQYKLLSQALLRLKGTTITTNITHQEKKNGTDAEETIHFGLIDSSRIINGKMIVDILPRLKAGDSYRVQRGITASLVHLGGFLLLTACCTVHFTG